MKKVTILSLHLGYGGIEKAICDVANMLSSKYKVEIVSIYKLYDKPIFNINDNIVVKYLVPNMKPNRVEIRNALNSKKLFTFCKEICKSFKILYLRKYKMIKYIKNCNSEIIISSRILFDKLLSKYGKKETLKIGWEHNHHHGNMKYANKVINSCKKLDYLVVVSNDLKKFYDDKFKHTIVVNIPNALDSIPQNVSNLKSRRLVSVGRLSIEKGYIDLLKIYNLINKTGFNWKLDIIGDGPERDNLQKYIKSEKLENNITLHGFKNKEYINEILNNSSIYLMTSHTESFGIVLLEAMSYGIPCIAFSSAEGANEIIDNGENGFLIDNRNINEFVDKLKLLSSDYKLRKKMGICARKSISKYSSEEISKLWINILKEK